MTTHFKDLRHFASGRKRVGVRLRTQCQQATAVLVIHRVRRFRIPHQIFERSLGRESGGTLADDVVEQEAQTALRTTRG